MSIRTYTNVFPHSIDRLQGSNRVSDRYKLAVYMVEVELSIAMLIDGLTLLKSINTPEAHHYLIHYYQNCSTSRGRWSGIMTKCANPPNSCEQCSRNLFYNYACGVRVRGMVRSDRAACTWASHLLKYHRSDENYVYVASHYYNRMGRFHTHHAGSGKLFCRISYEYTLKHLITDGVHKYQGVIEEYIKKCEPEIKIALASLPPPITMLVLEYWDTGLLYVGV